MAPMEQRWKDSCRATWWRTFGRPSKPPDRPTSVHFKDEQCQLLNKVNWRHVPYLPVSSITMWYNFSIGVLRPGNLCSYIGASKNNEKRIILPLMCVVRMLSHKISVRLLLQFISKRNMVEDLLKTFQTTGQTNKRRNHARTQKKQKQKLKNSS